MATEYAKISLDGLWYKNVATVQVLGLCPLLAVTGSVVNAMGLGLATMGVLIGSNLAVSLIRQFVTDAVRLPVFVMIIASITTCVEFLMQAFTFELYEILGIFIPLIVTNCCILGRADAFASKNPVIPSVVDGFMMGAGFLVVLLILGALREIIGQGTLFADFDLLFGASAAQWEIKLFDEFPGVLFAALPPGAFLGLGLIMALKNVFDARLEARAKAQQAPVTLGSKRVRTTGHIT
ncbi:MAG: electron transport complex subunit RsxE [Moraxellaceae bacterium]|nr:MAG: electron transport complex subunit RsxE [Moraxellaceae bacterium]